VQLLSLLQHIQQNMEAMAQFANLSQINQLPGYHANMRHGIQYHQRPFSQSTCEKLIVRYGNGSLFISFEQFCLLMEFVRAQKLFFSAADLDSSGSLHMQELVQVFQKRGIPITADQLRLLTMRYDQDGSGNIEFDEFIAMIVEWEGTWSQMGNFQTQFQSFGQQRAGPLELQQALGQIRTFYNTIGGVVPSIRPFSPHTCRQLIASYGVPRPGEQFASGVSYTEFERIVVEVRMAQANFTQSNMTGSGCISAAELATALGRCGLPIDMSTIQMMMACYDYDRNGVIEFDEFLQMLLECRLYYVRIQQMSIPAVNQSAMMQMLYSMPRQFIPRM